MKQPLIVNLYGAPGAGKSTGAAYVFSKLKLKGYNVELVTEFAKDKVYEGSKAVFENQAYIFGKQFFRMSRISDVDVIITDCPLMLSAFYAEKNNFNYAEELKALVKKVSSEQRALNVFVQRDKPYNPNGRFQSEEESDEICSEITDFLDANKVRYINCKGNEAGYDELISIVEQNLDYTFEVVSILQSLVHYYIISDVMFTSLCNKLAYLEEFNIEPIDDYRVVRELAEWVNSTLLDSYKVRVLANELVYAKAKKLILSIEMKYCALCQSRMVKGV